MNKEESSLKNSLQTNSSPSFVKLAMKNMVRKGSQSIKHFGLTAFGFIFFIVILAWLGRPNFPG